MARSGFFDFELQHKSIFDYEVNSHGIFDFELAAGAATTATITGTAVPTITESDVVTGGKTIIITLSGDTWVTAGAAFDAIRQDIINGLDAAASPATGWNLVVQAGQGVAGVVRTSNTVVTVTLDAFATYNIASTETITVTVPATAVALGVAITGTPTFNVTAIVTATDVEQFLLLGVGF